MDQKDLRCCFGNFFLEIVIPQAMLKVLSQQLQDTLTREFERHSPVEDFAEMDRQRCGASTKTFDLLLCASLSLKQT